MKSLIVLLLVCNICNAQMSEKHSSSNNGKYHLLDGERGVNNKPTKTKLFQFGNHLGKKMLAIAACERCMPATYNYQEKESKMLKIPVYFNTSGIYLLGYDENSFVAVLVDKILGSGEWKNFTFSNFYSKDVSKVSLMTKAKISNYAKSIAKKAMK